MSIRVPGYRYRIAERFGFIDTSSLEESDVLWIHASSVGEVFVAIPLINSFLNKYPNLKLVVTTSTPTGSDLVRQHLGEAAIHFFAPWDLLGSVRRFLGKINPKVLVLIEKELWPNLISLTAANNCAIFLVNARLSPGSADRYRKFGALVADMLHSLSGVACQSAEDGHRFKSLGLPSERLFVTGNIKFDIEISRSLEEEKQFLIESNSLASRFVIVAASTHPGEEKIILESFAAIKEHRKDVLLVLAPRHVERCEEIAQELRAQNWRFLLHSEKRSLDATQEVLLVDTTGELFKLMGVANVAVIGGSFVPRGGHNMLEAVAWGVPVLTGPHTENFAEISKLLISGEAMLQIQPALLSDSLLRLLEDEKLRVQMGASGKKILENNRGAKDRTLKLLASALS